MCGASDQQKEVEQEQNDFYRQAIQEQSAAYGEDQAILKEMRAAYEPILAKGPNQEGFSDAEKNDLNTQVIEGTARNYSAAAKAVNEQLASRGGGDEFLPSGADAELKAETAASAAAEESREQSQVKEADYAQGFNEWENAANGLATVSGQLNPTAYTSAANEGGSAASKTANDIAQESNSWINAAIGAAGAIGGGVMGNPNIFK